jgi:hypothetical protein
LLSTLGGCLDTDGSPATLIIGSRSSLFDLETTPQNSFPECTSQPLIEISKEVDSHAFPQKFEMAITDTDPTATQVAPNHLNPLQSVQRAIQDKL